MQRLLVRLNEFLRKFIWVIGPYFPGISMNTIWRKLDKQAVTILDIGGGPGEPMEFLGKKHRLCLKVNADITLSRLKQGQQKQSHDEYILCDARSLPFKEKSFDIVLCLEIIEHIPKEDGLRLLSDLDKIAKRQIILSTPVNERIDPNPRKVKTFPWSHFSTWHPTELRKLGYEVKGDGFPCIRGCLLVASTNQILSLLGCLLYPLANPFVYFFPNQAGGMIGVKSLSHEVKPSREM
jgi:hypothetical protein